MKSDGLTRPGRSSERSLPPTHMVQSSERGGPTSARSLPRGDEPPSLAHGGRSLPRGLLRRGESCHATPNGVGCNPTAARSVLTTSLERESRDPIEPV